LKNYNIAVVGATGLVGREMLKIFKERNFPINTLRLFASSRSAGKKLEFLGKDIIVEEVEENSFKNIDIALFSAGSSAAEEIAPLVTKNGGVVIDNSSAFRMNKDVPLVVPEVNGSILTDKVSIIANPNCSTIQMVVVLQPLLKKYGLKRLVISTYQAVSGAGKKAVDELLSQSRSFLNNEEIKKENFNHQIAFNSIPQIDDFLENNYTKEEMKMVNETRKILNENKLSITATCVRTPVIFGHAESVNVELKREFDLEELKNELNNFKNIKVVDNPEKELYPLQTDTEKTDKILVGRIRRDYSQKNSVNLWIAANNLRKGAALNTVQIAEYLIENNLIS